MRFLAFILCMAALTFVACIIHWSLVDSGPVRSSDSFYVYSALGGIGWLNINLHAAFPLTPTHHVQKA